MIHQITVDFQPIDGRPGLDQALVNAGSLHGLLFQNVLPQVNVAETTWLHEHPAPKPFALAPLSGERGFLTGLRLSAFTERAADLLAQGWQQAHEGQATLRLGPQAFQVREVACQRDIEFSALLTSPPRNKMTLRFLTPTAFRQGPRNLYLPLPGNIFARPFEMWQTYAPAALKMPAGWLAWCQDAVAVSRHHIRTERMPLNEKAYFTGFVGTVHFIAPKDEELYLRLWQALGRLATFCGVGHKTTQGLGQTEIQVRHKS
jgi:CRISPR-associated endoribonuclease Cas6